MSVSRSMFGWLVSNSCLRRCVFNQFTDNFKSTSDDVKGTDRSDDSLYFNETILSENHRCFLRSSV